MNDPSHTYPFHCHGTGNQATLFVKVDRWSADTNCKSDKDCPGSYCMDDPTKTKPFNCHAEAPSGETVLYSVINRNHCQEVHVANSQFKGFWDAVGNWVKILILQEWSYSYYNAHFFFAFFCFLLLFLRVTEICTLRTW